MGTAALHRCRSWGISATVQRFEAAMTEAEVQSNRVHLGTVQVDPVRIQESGLLKDDIVLDFPAETGDFNTVPCVAAFAR